MTKRFDTSGFWPVALTAFGLLCPLSATRAQEAAPTASQASFEKQFLAEMPQHHQMGVKAFQVCESKAQHAELKSLCQKMSAKQQQEAGQMNGWRQAWYGGQGSVPPTEKTKMMTQQNTMMAKLKAASGPAFDHEFLQSTIQHHQEGIEKARACEGQAGHAELKNLCQQMIEEQSKEVKQMQSWLQNWQHGSSAQH